MSIKGKEPNRKRERKELCTKRKGKETSDKREMGRA